MKTVASSFDLAKRVDVDRNTRAVEFGNRLATHPEIAPLNGGGAIFPDLGLGELIGLVIHLTAMNLAVP